MPFLFAAIAALTGICSALQSGSNSTLAKVLGTPAWATAIVAGVTFGGALAVAFGALLFAGQRPPGAGVMAAVPWWAWIGGAFGLTFLLSTVFVAPRLGAAVFVSVTVTASTITSLALDHWGLMGFPVQEANWGRLAGGALMAGGVALIAIF